MAAIQKIAAQPYDIEVVNLLAKHNLKSARGCAVCFVAAVLSFDLCLSGCMSASGLILNQKTVRLTIASLPSYLPRQVDQNLHSFLSRHLSVLSLLKLFQRLIIYLHNMCIICSL